MAGGDLPKAEYISIKLGTGMAVAHRQGDVREASQVRHGNLSSAWLRPKDAWREQR
ncbi:hypothetical protein GCM10022402_14240 [Salinactinospora qingdaonensis]|uniref:Uncharacterized protein n=1 Tax=Salinactinospora qingdaonensis TaxID=702744 RepID=A0ABP7FBZ2_9ACTN